MIQVRNQRKVNQSRSLSRDENPADFSLGVANTMCSDVSALPLPLGGSL